MGVARGPFPGFLPRSTPTPKDVGRRPPDIPVVAPTGGAGRSPSSRLTGPAPDRKGSRHVIVDADIMVRFDLARGEGLVTGTVTSDFALRFEAAVFVGSVAALWIRTAAPGRMFPVKVSVWTSRGRRLVRTVKVKVDAAPAPEVAARTRRFRSRRAGALAGG